MSTYQRFKIKTNPTPPRRKLPRPFNPTVKKLGLAKMLLAEAWHYGFKLSREEYREALMSRPCIYGVFSGSFGGFHPIKEKCTGCMRCVQEHPEFCAVERNPEFFRVADSYWVPQDPSTSATTNAAIIWQEAATGKIPVKGMGYKGGFGGRGWDGIWTDMSEIVRPTRDGVYGREYISTLVDIGRKPKFLTFDAGEPKETATVVSIEIPVIFDWLPEGLNNQNILEVCAKTSAQIPTFFIATPKQASSLSENLRSRWIPLVTSADFNRYDFHIRQAPLIELNEINPSLIESVKKINPSAPLAVRLPLTKNAGVLAAQLESQGVDIIHLVANYHGQGQEPDAAQFSGDLIRAVHQSLVKAGVRDQITLIASGGITLAEHVPKAIICGTDLVAINTTILVALQMDFKGECVSETEAKIRQESFDPAWGAERLVNLLAAWHYQLIEILSAMGMRDVRRLRGDVGRAIFQEDLDKQFFNELAQS